MERTFGDLRQEILSKAGVDMFAFRQLSPLHDELWEDMNRVEWSRGYVPGVYEKPGTPALCDMKLLTQKEYQTWLTRFERLGKPQNRKRRSL